MKTNPTTLALVLAALSATVPAARAADRKPDTRDAAAQVCPADDRVAITAGLRAFVDPQTGQLREPTEEEIQALSAAARLELAREINSLETVVHPDGMISLDLKGLFLQSVVVRRAADGSLVMGCVEGPNPTVPPDLAPAKKAPVLEER